jgi:hypothetical protein
MSSEKSSREALEAKEFLNLPSKATATNMSFFDWTIDNLDRVKSSTGTVKEKHKEKWEKFYSAIAYPAGEAPKVVRELSRSTPPPPQESPDVEWVKYEETIIGKRINTLDTILVEIDDPPVNHAGPFSIRQLGRNPDTGKIKMAQVPAKEVKVRPEQVMRYNGSVVKDNNAVHSNTVSLGGRRELYSFDRMYEWQGKTYTRCCLVLDRVHMAGLLFDSYVDKRTRMTRSKIRCLEGTDKPMYIVIGMKNKEQDIRDLRRLYERYFMRKKDAMVSEESDPALKKLQNMIQMA